MRLQRVPQPSCSGDRPPPQLPRPRAVLLWPLLCLCGRSLAVACEQAACRAQAGCHSLRAAVGKQVLTACCLCRWWSSPVGMPVCADGAADAFPAAQSAARRFCGASGCSWAAEDDLICSEADLFLAVRACALCMNTRLRVFRQGVLRESCLERACCLCIAVCVLCGLRAWEGSGRESAWVRDTSLAGGIRQCVLKSHCSESCTCMSSLFTDRSKLCKQCLDPPPRIFCS